MVFSYWFVSSYKNIKKIFTFWHTYLLFILKSACYSVTKYYLCRQNNKRSLLGRKQRIQVARSFPNHYLFSCTNKVTSLFSISCISRIILLCKMSLITRRYASFHNMIKHCNAWENIIPMAQNQIIYNMVYAKMQDDVYKITAHND